MSCLPSDRFNHVIESIPCIACGVSAPYAGREIVAVVLDPVCGFDFVKMFDERAGGAAAVAATTATRGDRSERLKALQSHIPPLPEAASVDLLMQSPDLGRCEDIQGECDTCGELHTSEYSQHEFYGKPGETS